MTQTQPPVNPALEYPYPSASYCFREAGDALEEAARQINNAGGATYANESAHATVAISKGWAFLGGQIAGQPVFLDAVLEGREVPAMAQTEPPTWIPAGGTPLPNQHQADAAEFRMRSQGSLEPVGQPVAPPDLDPTFDHMHTNLCRHDWELGDPPRKCRQCGHRSDVMVDGSPLRVMMCGKYCVGAQEFMKGQDFPITAEGHE